MILSNATVHSLEDGILTLQFNRDGDLKGFTTSGCDADLKRVLSAGFGLNVMVNGMVGASAVSSPGGRPPGDPPFGGTHPPEPPAGGTSSPQAPVRRDSAPRTDLPGPPPAPYDDDDEPDDMPTAPSGAYASDDEPDDYVPPGSAQPAGPAELTGMDLIQRDLGGQIIREIES
jgi:DNA polymerase-3 subunit gamma/tau